MSLDAPAVQRLRLDYAKGEPLRFVSHLDMMRLWERACRRARLPIAHTQGFNPRPRIALACPLPTGVTSRAEKVDLFLTARLDPREVLRRLHAVLPAGVEVFGVAEVTLTEPALMSLPATVEYQARVEWDGPAANLEACLRAWLAQGSVVRQRERKGRAGEYDLRPLVEHLWVVGQSGGRFVVGMRVKSGPQGTGRPDEVLKSLGLWDSARGLERTAVVVG
ncbi:MAG: hypothetical protein Kow00123_10420 [Anaerolineales bacterium]